MTDDEKHRACCHPNWEYESTETPRKCGFSLKPKGEGWEPNNRIENHQYEQGEIVSEHWRNWERYEFHEVEYWRRLRATKEK